MIATRYHLAALGYQAVRTMRPYAIDTPPCGRAGYHPDRHHFPASHKESFPHAATRTAGERGGEWSRFGRRPCGLFHHLSVSPYAFCIRHEQRRSPFHPVTAHEARAPRGGPASPLPVRSLRYAIRRGQLRGRCRQCWGRRNCPTDNHGNSAISSGWIRRSAHAVLCKPA